MTDTINAAQGSVAAVTGIDPWAEVIGQGAAIATLEAWVAEPVHAYLFTGPSGTGKAAAAFAFAGAILAHGESPEAGSRHLSLALARKHPDVEMYSPQSNTIDVKGVKDLIPLVFKKPIEGRRRIVIVDRFHDASPPAAAALLKPVEEPPSGTVLILLREVEVPEHIAIASRSVEVPFPALAQATVIEWLVEQGVDVDRAAGIAEAAGGDLNRARLLIPDEAFAVRAEAWRMAPTRLDGSGYAVGQLASELKQLIDEACELLGPVHDAELAELAEREEALGTRGSGRAEIELRHKRELRRIRTDELKFGLAALSRRYGARLAAGGGAEIVAAIDRIRDANEALVRNPNEPLLLQNLFWNLPGLVE